MHSSNRWQSGQPSGQHTVGVIAEMSYFRESLVRCLAQKLSMTALDLGCGDGDSIESVSRLSPDVVLLDSSARPRIEIVHEILRSSPDTRVVVLGVPEEEELILRLAEAGVAGFVSPNSSFDDLMASIENSMQSELTCSPKIAAALLRRVATLASAKGKKQGPPLTPRENQILQMIERSLSNKEIAAQLSIGPGTVKTHVHHILEKLAVQRRAEVGGKGRQGRTET